LSVHVHKYMMYACAHVWLCVYCANVYVDTVLSRSIASSLKIENVSKLLNSLVFSSKHKITVLE